MICLQVPALMILSLTSKKSRRHSWASRSSKLSWVSKSFRDFRDFRVGLRVGVYGLKGRGGEEGFEKLG